MRVTCGAACCVCWLLVQVMRDRESKVSRGFAFVTFVHAAHAEAAMTELNNATPGGPFMGRPLRVSASNKPR